MQEILQCLSCNGSCFKDKCKLRQHLASLWRKKPRAEKMLKMPAWQHEVMRTPEWQGFCPGLLPHVLCLVFQSAQRKTAAFHAEGIWEEFLHSCKQWDFSHMNFMNSQKGARHVLLSVQRCNKVMNKSQNER